MARELDELKLKAMNGLVDDEVRRVAAKEGPFNSAHEGYCIMLEEVDELWDAIKADEPQERVIAELVQVAAMCARYFETGDRYRGVHPTVRRSP